MGKPEDTPLAAEFLDYIYAKWACSACFASLIHGLKQLKEEGLPLPETVRIGQGFKRKISEGLGSVVAFPGILPLFLEIRLIPMKL
ncbi:MAG: hypothetical protein GY699_16525 [Desulfobacteraceae bacterium]|nr:hypothetical protein [Desulfobacteraceae bacterium]